MLLCVWCSHTLLWGVAANLNTHSYARCIAVMRSGNRAADLEALFHSLPTCNQELLKYLAAFIARLIPHAAATKMELVQFCTVFVSAAP